MDDLSTQAASARMWRLKKKKRQGTRTLCLAEKPGSCTPSILQSMAPETASSPPFLSSSLSSRPFLVKSFPNFPNREFALI